MGRILRNIAMNPVEPAQLSFRAPFGMQTFLDMTVADAKGVVINYDIAAQLQLIRRTDGRTQSYGAPATDLANGKIRVTFPAGELSDRNGYHLRLFGTVNGAAELIATGEVRITATMGPQAMPDDVIDAIPLVFTQSTPVQLDITLWQDEGKTIPYDLSVVGVSAAIYPDKLNAVPLLQFNQSPTGPNSLRLSLSSAQVDSLPATCWWSLRVSSSGQLKTLAEGPVSVTSAPAGLLVPNGGNPS